MSDGSADQMRAAAAATMGAANEVPLAHTMTWPVEPVQSIVVISAMLTPGAISGGLMPSLNAGCPAVMRAAVLYCGSVLGLAM